MCGTTDIRVCTGKHSEVDENLSILLATRVVDLDGRIQSVPSRPSFITMTLMYEGSMNGPGVEGSVTFP